MHKSEQDSLSYLSGFGSAMESEALPGALPRHQNSPKRAPHGLYPEVLNGTAFTMRRAHNRRSWLYRIRPSVVRSEATHVPQARLSATFSRVAPEQIRWRALPLPQPPERVDFLGGLVTVGGAGSPELRNGFAVHLYAANADMKERAFYNADGDLLLLPEQGSLRLRTEFGWLHVRPGELAVVQRGMTFSVELPDGVGRGSVLETYGAHLRLPERGLIGANSLADERHFLSPVAAYEDREAPGFELFFKYGGELYRSTLRHSPYDVVAWHGNYVPYKYDLARFNTLGSVSFDHPDPSLNTVLSAPLDEQGNSLADVLVFGGHWEVAENTFRPPYYHRNAASEFMHVLRLERPFMGFEPGDCFLTPPMTAHGQDADVYRFATEMPDAPMRVSDEFLWVMYESALQLKLTPWALETSARDTSYNRLWEQMPKTFQPPR